MKSIFIVCDSHMGLYIIFGDFNEVMQEEERYGFVFLKQGANNFNRFIDESGLITVQMGARIRMFTWMNKMRTNMSKLDRFFYF